MRDDPTFNIKFVQLVEKYRVIYDHTLDKYSNRHIQEKTWNDFGKELNESGSACKEKWKNIRSAFSRHLRQKLPTGSAAKLKKPYYLAEYLDFLITFTKSRAQQSNISSPPAAPDENNAESNHSDCIDEVENESNASLDEFQEDITNETELSTNTQTSNFGGHIPKKKQKHEKVSKLKGAQKDLDPLEKCAIDYFQSKNSTKERDDPDFQFLKSILPDMHAMNNRQKHEFKMRTITTIGEILYGSTPQTYSFHTSRTQTNNSNFDEFLTFPQPTYQDLPPCNSNRLSSTQMYIESAAPSPSYSSVTSISTPRSPPQPTYQDLSPCNSNRLSSTHIPYIESAAPSPSYSSVTSISTQRSPPLMSPSDDGY